MGRRFKLDPSMSATENLWEACRVATIVVLRSHGYYGLTRETRDELFGEIWLATVKNFLATKVAKHTYCRKAKDGRPLDFLDNCISACWSVAHGIADRHIKALDRKSRTCDIESCAFSLSTQDGLPLYLGYYDYDSSKNSRRKSMEQTTPYQRSQRVLELYDDYKIECEDVGATPLSFEGWLVSTGYNRDHEMMLMLLPKEERSEMQRAKRLFDAGMTLKQIEALDYNRDYRRRKAKERRMAKSS